MYHFKRKSFTIKKGTSQGRDRHGGGMGEEQGQTEYDMYV